MKLIACSAETPPTGNQTAVHDPTGSGNQGSSSKTGHILIFLMLYSVNRLRIKKNVVIKQLSINVSASDQSYMPEIVTVSVSKGRSHNLKEIREVKIAA